MRVHALRHARENRACVHMYVRVYVCVCVCVCVCYVVLRYHPRGHSYLVLPDDPITL